MFMFKKKRQEGLLAPGGFSMNEYVTLGKMFEHPGYKSYAFALC